jgi:hypothetical protein
LDLRTSRDGHGLAAIESQLSREEEEEPLSLSLASLPLSLFLRHLPAQEEEEEVKEKRRERSKRKEINESDLTFSGLKLLAYFLSSNKDLAYDFQSSTAVQSKSI